jgi:glutathione S-transferase
MTPLKLFQIAPSPNCMKARVALGFKGVPYEPIPVDPQERAALIEATGQPLTPAIVHGQVKLYDSGAVMRYIDANFEGPRLFSEDRDEMREIENWEWHARAGVRDSLGAVYAMAFGGIETTQENIATVRAGLEKEADHVATRLDKAGGWLAAGRMTAADVTMASIFSYTVGLDTLRTAGGPFGVFVAEHFTVGDTWPALRIWAEAVMGHDAWLQALQNV